MTDNQVSCRDCGNELAARDLTCPRCGAIIDRFLFGTVILKSLDVEGRKAYQAGFQACMKQSAETGSSTIRAGSYHPLAGKETEYRAGWRDASEKVEAKADRKFGRRRGIIVLGSGIAFLVIGLAIAFGTLSATGGHVVVISYVPIGLGVMNIVIGIVMMLTGYNDEARPPAPQSSTTTRGEDIQCDLAIAFDAAVSGTQVELTIPQTASTSRKLKVNVPAGVDDGNRLRLVGQGGAGVPAGDLYVVLSVAKHPYFERQDADLHCVARLTQENGARPSEVTIETLEGPLQLRVPTEPGESRVVLKEKGIRRLAGTGRGDLIVHFPDLEVPH